MPALKYFKNHDYIITICVFLLSILSLVLIYSTTFNAQTLEGGSGTFKKQILFFIVGFFVYFLLSTFDISWLQNFRILLIIYAITLFLLIYVRFFGGEIASTNRWLTFFGFSFQPAEFAKITLTIMTAAIFSHQKEQYEKIVNWKNKQKASNSKKFRKVLKFIDKNFPDIYRYLFSFLVAFPIIFLVFIQPAFGNSFIITVLWLCIVFAASNAQLIILNFLFPLILIPLNQWGAVDIESVFNDLDMNLVVKGISISFIILIALISLIFSLKSKLRWYFIIISIVIALSIKPAVLQVWDSSLISDYQKERIETFFDDPEKDPLDAGYQVRQSKIAIGAGRLFGRGYLQGTQSTLRVLPFAHTDFIFASLAEQFGLVGSMILILTYLVLLIRVQRISSQTKDEFAFLLSIGFCIMLMLNIFINIGMNMGKLPVTGIPLPLVSYGGSSVLVNLIGLGLVQAARKRITLKDISESFTPNANPWT